MDMDGLPDPPCEKLKDKLSSWLIYGYFAVSFPVAFCFCFFFWDKSVHYSFIMGVIAFTAPAWILTIWGSVTLLFMFTFSRRGTFPPKVKLVATVVFIMLIVGFSCSFWCFDRSFGDSVIFAMTVAYLSVTFVPAMCGVIYLSFRGLIDYFVGSKDD